MRKKHSFHEIWRQDRVIWVSIITIAVLFVPTGLAHETGHALVCISNGLDYSFYLADLAFNIECSKSPRPIAAYWALGGIFGMTASLMLIISARLRNDKGVLIGIIVTAFDHLQKTVFETFMHQAYLSNPSLLVFMSILSLILLGSLLWFYGGYRRLRPGA